MTAALQIADALLDAGMASVLPANVNATSILALLRSNVTAKAVALSRSSDAVAELDPEMLATPSILLIFKRKFPVPTGTAYLSFCREPGLEAAHAAHPEILGANYAESCKAAYVSECQGRMDDYVAGNRLATEAEQQRIRAGQNYPIGAGYGAQKRRGL